MEHPNMQVDDDTDNVSEFSSQSGSSYGCSYQYLDPDLHVQMQRTHILQKLQSIKEQYLKDIWEVRENFKKRLHLQEDEANLAHEVVEHMDILQRMAVLMVADHERLPRGLSEETCDVLVKQSNWYVKRFKGERFARTFQELADCVQGKRGTWVFRPQASKKMDLSSQQISIEELSHNSFAL